MRLTLELHVSRVEYLHVFNLDIFALKDVVSLFDMCVEHGNQIRLVEHGKRLVDCPNKVMPQVCNETAQSVGQAGTGWNKNLGNAKLARQRGRMERPGTAEGQKDEIPGIMPTRQRDKSNGAGHLVVGHPDHGSCGLFRAKLQRTSHAGT